MQQDWLPEEQHIIQNLDVLYAPSGAARGFHQEKGLTFSFFTFSPVSVTLEPCA